MENTLAGRAGGSKINFLQRMKLWQKFALLGVVALAALAYPLYAVVKSTGEVIENVRLESNGLQPIRSIELVLQSMQDHRTTSSYFLLNDPTRAAGRPKAAADVDSGLAALIEYSGSINDPVMTKRLADIRQEWVALRAADDARRNDSRATIAAHSALIRKTMLLIQDVTAHSLIDLDPDAAAYYAFRASLIDLPQLKEAIRALRSPVTDRLEEIVKLRKSAEQSGKEANLDAVLQGAWRAEDRALFLSFIELGENAYRSYADNMRKGMAASPSMKAEMNEQVAQITQLTESAMAYARRELLAKPIPTVAAGDYQREVSISREAALKASDQTGKVLGNALAARESRARTELQVELGVTAVLLLIGLTVAFLTVRNITGTVSNLQDSVERVRQGDFEALGHVESQDEVGDLGRTVNSLLQERIGAQQQAETEKKNAEDENERLNNSVISILQAVHQLSQKDLTAKAPVTQDVIGTVSDSINLMTDETAKVLHGVNLIAGQVAAGSGKVKTQADLVSQTSEEERRNVGEMMNSLADANESVNQVAALAEQSNTSAEQATTATRSALEAVDGTVRGMESIRETISETEKRIKRLGERSQEISGIVNLINTISERTHVLALNASMQAAVAGEAGRGFAVVAEEVQRLAESSRNATQQIGTLVSNIQLETNETIATVNRTIGQVVQGSEQAQRAGEQMRQTQQITGELVANVRRISVASDQQKDMSAQLLASVQNIGQSTERTAQQISAQNVETDSLVSAARRLVESVAVFKLPAAV